MSNTTRIAKQARITQNMLSRAKNLCSAREALPKDWDDWFPSAIPLLVKVEGPHVTAQHILDYAKARLENITDTSRFVEASQCLMLLHFLGQPLPDTIVTSAYGK